MAKKKATEIETSEVADASVDFSSHISEKYGDGILVPASFIIERPTQVMNVSPAIDIGIHGGVPEGSWFTLSGKPKCGKTTVALHFAAKCQKAGKKIFYGNVEVRLKAMNLTSAGLDASKVSVVQSKEGKILSGEEHLEIYADIIKHNPGCVLIIDSTSALCSASEFDANIEEQQRPGIPKALAKFCRKIGQTVTIQRSIIVLIQHLMTAQGAGMSYKMEDGGEKVQYQNDVKLRCKAVAPWDDKEKQIGQIVTWEVAWCALGGPKAQITNYLRYGIGVDEVTELIMMAADFGLITKSGSWYVLDFLDGQKLQGQEKLYEYFIANTDYIIKLQAALKEML